MKAIPKMMTSVAAGFLTTLGLALTLNAATAGEALAGPSAETNQGGMSQFQILLQRNIFDPNRGSEATNRETVAKRPTRIETFSFRGAAERVGEGFDGFFMGDGAPISGIVDVNGMINGFKVLEINLTEAKLMSTNQEVVILKDQTGLTRQDGGPWMKLAVPATYKSSASSRQGQTTSNYNTDDGASAMQAETTAAPAPIDSAMLAKLQARRAMEN